MLTALRSLPNLASLCLRYRPDPMAADPSMGTHQFLDILCEFFESSEVPLPALESLTLQMVDHALRSTPAADCCTRLAHALVNSSRYPDFGHLGVTIQPHIWTNLAGGVWYRTRLTDERRQELMEMWRDAFEAFEGRSGVTFEVSDVDISAPLNRAPQRHG